MMGMVKRLMVCTECDAALVGEACQCGGHAMIVCFACDIPPFDGEWDRSGCQCGVIASVDCKCGAPVPLTGDGLSVCDECVARMEF